MAIQVGIPVQNSGSQGRAEGRRIGVDINGPAASASPRARDTRRDLMPMDDSTRESLASAIEHPCAPCVYGDHASCLAPIGDEGNCCCDIDGWAP